MQIAMTDVRIRARLGKSRSLTGVRDDNASQTYDNAASAYDNASPADEEHRLGIPGSLQGDAVIMRRRGWDESIDG